MGPVSAAWQPPLIFAAPVIPSPSSNPPNTVGGLAAGFKEPHWDWSVERFYHHWFTSDKSIFGLLGELGLSSRVVIPRPKTVAYYNGRFYPLDSPAAALTFPGFSFPFGMIRFGLATVYLRYLANWPALEKHLAHDWMRKWYGQRAYETMLEPLLVGKFGRHYNEVNMAWMWARIKARTTRLATFEGGFQAFSDLFAERLRRDGVIIRLSTPVDRIHPLPDGRLRLDLPGGAEEFDQVLSTTSPSLLARLAPSLPDQYLKGLLDLKHMGAVVLTLSLRHQLSTQGYYWYNLPKSAGFPFLALVEHTNFLSPDYFGGDHIVYLRRLSRPRPRVFPAEQRRAARTLPALSGARQSTLQARLAAQLLAVAHQLCPTHSAAQSLAQHPRHPDPHPRSLLRQYEPGLPLGPRNQLRRGDRPAGRRLDAAHRVVVILKLASDSTKNGREHCCKSF